MNYYIFNYNGEERFHCNRWSNLYRRFKYINNDIFNGSSNNLEHMIKSKAFFEKGKKINEIKSINCVPCFANYSIDDLIYKLIL